MVTRERLLEALDYNPETGIFIWKIGKRGPGARPGNTAGSSNPLGYLRIMIDRKAYAASRLAWFYVTGKWPCAEMDHIDRNPANNRFDNLREASRFENMKNTGSCAASGLKGAFRNKKAPGTWFSHIMVDRKLTYLGAFRTAQEAHEAYCEAASRLHGEFACFG